MLVCASGAGSNAEALMARFAGHDGVSVCAVACNRPSAGVLSRAWRRKIPVWLFGKDEERKPEAWRDLLATVKPDLIVLAGWLKLIPAEIISQHPRTIVNLHPSLLPKYGGPGMYGMKVHEAVIRSGEAESGITVHYVNEQYDKGPIIHQETIAVQPNWSASDLQSAIHRLELQVFPAVIESLLLNLQS